MEPGTLSDRAKRVEGIAAFQPYMHSSTLGGSVT